MKFSLIIKKHSMSTSPVVDKVKPYSVVDLTTHCILSDEEVSNCLRTATNKQLRKYYGEYGRCYAKPNGDAPNFISLPPKLAKSRSINSLLAPNGHISNERAYSQPRIRCYTAPPFIVNDIPLLPQVKEKKFRPTSSQHSSSGCVKFKINQITQRNMQAPRNYSGGLRPPMQLKSPSMATTRLKQPEIKESQGRFPNKVALPRMSPHSSYSTTDTFQPNSTVNMAEVNFRSTEAGTTLNKTYSTPKKEEHKLSSPNQKPDKLQANSGKNLEKIKNGFLSLPAPISSVSQRTENSFVQSRLDIESGKQLQDLKIVNEFSTEKGKQADKTKFSKIPSTLSIPRSLSSLSTTDSSNTEDKKSTELVKQKRKLSLESIERPKIDVSTSEKIQCIPNKTMAVSQFASVSKLSKFSNVNKPGVSHKPNSDTCSESKSNSTLSTKSSNLKLSVSIKEDSKGFSSLAAPSSYSTFSLKPSSNILYKYSESKNVGSRINSETFLKNSSNVLSDQNVLNNATSNSFPNEQKTSPTDVALNSLPNEQKTLPNEPTDALNELRITGPNLINKEMLKRISYKKTKRSQSDVNNHYHHKNNTSYEEQEDQEKKTLKNPTIGKIPSALARSYSPLSFNMISLKNSEVVSEEKIALDDKVLKKQKYSNHIDDTHEIVFEENESEEDLCSIQDLIVEDECNGYMEQSQTLQKKEDFTIFMKEYGIGIDKKRLDEHADKNEEYNLQMMDDPFSFVEESRKTKQILATTSSPVSNSSLNFDNPLLLLSKGEETSKDYEGTSSLDESELSYYEKKSFRDDVMNKITDKSSLKTLHKPESLNQAPSKDVDPFDNFAVDVPFGSQTNDTVYQLHTMTLDREKKKKSKLKKFFQKLSSKKDGPKIEFEYCGVREQPSTPTSTHYGINSFVSDRKFLYGRSDSTLMSHSLQDLHSVNNNKITRQNSFYFTPTSKRRVFSFSFMKKGRNRSTTSCHVITDTQPDLIAPSETFQTCSPSMGQRSYPIKLARRVSDPYVYRILPPATQTINPAYNYKRDKSSSSASSDNDENYINFPFSKNNMQPPRKPIRSNDTGVVNDLFVNHSGIRASTSSSLSNPIDQKFVSVSEHEEFKGCNTNNDGNREDRLRCNSSDSSMFGESISIRSSNSNSDTDFTTTQKKESFTEHVNSNCLRRTPLRHADDSYNKIIEVHKQAVEKIARQVSTLHCSCDSLNELGWDDFERKKDPIQLGLSNYIVIPVKRGDKVYSAWLNHSLTSDVSNADYTKSTLHPNCLHICHKIVQNNKSPQDGIPKTIQINSVCISPMLPKMTLSKYVSLTLEKHTVIPESYEREAAMILLQAVKGIQHLYKNNLQATSLSCENIFILDTGEHSVVLSPRKKPNKCPSIIVAELPGMKSLLHEKGSMITTVCHQLAFVLYELLHCPYHDELREAHDVPMLQATLPTLTIKSIYTRYLQIVINFLVGSYTHTIKTLRDIRLMLEVLLFGPTEIDKNASVELIIKWHNRRCVDIVAHLLQATPIIMLTGSGRSEQTTPVDQEIILESEFLSDVTPEEIQSISVMLNR